MELFTHVTGSERPQIFEVEAGALVRTLLGNDEAEGHIWLKDVDEEVDPDLTIETAGMWHQDHVHRGHCRQVQVTVRFNETFEHVFGPATSIKTITEWVFGPEAANFSEEQTAENVLSEPGATHFLDSDVLIGSLVRPGSCTVTLELMPLFPFAG